MPVLDERLHDLLDEERVPARPLPDALGEPRKRRVGAEEVGQEGRDRLGAERHDWELLVVGPLHPAGVILGPEVEEQQPLRSEERLHVVG